MVAIYCYLVREITPPHFKPLKLNYCNLKSHAAYAQHT